MSLLESPNMRSYYGCIVAVSVVCTHYIAHRNQAIRLAAAALPQPTPPKKADRPQRSRAYRVTMMILQTAFLLVLFCTPSFIMNYVLPRIASQAVVDGFAVMLATAVWIMINGAFWTLLEDGVTWTWKEDASFPTAAVIAVPPKPSSNWLTSLIATIFTSAFVGMHYVGGDFITVINAGYLAPILIACNVNANRYSVKRLCKLVVFGFTAVVGLVALILGGAYLWDTYGSSGSEANPAEPKPDLKMPSAWISTMFAPFMFAIPFGVIMMFMTVTLRFDASQSDAILLQETPEIVYKEGDDKPIARVGNLHTNSDKPLFKAGMVSLILTAAATYFAMVKFVPIKAQNLCFLQLGLQLGNLTVPAGIAFTAWRLGKFREWYNFEEQYVRDGPADHRSLFKGDVLERQAMDDVENLLDEKK